MSVDLHETLTELQQAIGQVVVGKETVIQYCLTALLSGEHILLEDVPGVGKTLLGKALAKCITADFQRIQFTPDLLPSDIVGSSVFDNQTSEFVFNRGPLFANIVLADEINRTPPRTQAALLEGMSESQVTIDGKTLPLPQPFMVVATQNPFEFEGTYPLPESQLDRFLLRVSLGYPGREQERRILDDHRRGEPVNELKPILTRRDVLAMRAAVREVRFEASVQEYLLDIVEATRNCEDLHVGVSTRGAICLSRATQAFAFLQGRDYVVPDDVKGLAVPVISHRVISKTYLHGNQRSAVESLIRRLINSIPVPR
jgi:MoxR-like ATPase